MNGIIKMYITMMSTILAGPVNMIFVRTSFYKKHRYPIDGYKNFADGKRLFGDNKTWIGFLSMVTINTILQILLGGIKYISETSEFYIYHRSTFTYNLKIGFLLGLMYILCELPNSFVKRRLDIRPGKTQNTRIGHLFFVIDQIDSMFGVIAVLCVEAHLGADRYFEYLALGGLTHLVLNMILHRLKIKKNL